MKTTGSVLFLVLLAVMIPTTALGKIMYDPGEPHEITGKVITHQETSSGFFPFMGMVVLDTDQGIVTLDRLINYSEYKQAVEESRCAKAEVIIKTRVIGYYTKDGYRIHVSELQSITRR